MARRSRVRRGLPSVVVAVLVVALTVAVGGLVVLALQRTQGMDPERVARPAASVPAASLPVDSPSPTASAPPAVTAPAAAERYLAAGTDVLWRATAGACGGDAPVIERSDDDGATWTDETPLYRDIAQVRALRSVADTQATAVADVGEDCETQALRTFTDGAFWSPYDDVLARSDYLVGTDVVIDGDTLAAPCAEPWGLRSSAGTVAFICVGTAYATADGETTAISTDVVALDTLDGEIIAATRTPECDGLLLTSLTSDTDPLACVTADAATPAALAITPDAVLLWTGDDLTTVPR
ncbi:hypothetical protein NH287_08745 [Microbacterium sp. CnD16-F]|uniref:hypothetical protein n=1 Tax=Microbacterium sp. CnD16-F TaxID=2954493 RepID=UPI002096F238|nr:hypothetical protein [Microbacterium sp. CnD16-F]MCO7203578.1 hypothetical protein [Microbacterium sp. CnD16-F]